MSENYPVVEGQVVDAELTVNGEAPTPPAPSDLAFRAELVEHRRLVAQAQAVVDAKSAELKAAKAVLEMRMDRLLSFIDDQAVQPDLPFPEPAEGEVPPEDDWQDVPLATVLSGKVSGKVVEKLAEAGLKTLGDLAEYTKERQLTDIDGIGPQKADIIEAALSEWWEKRNKEGT